MGARGVPWGPFEAQGPRVSILGTGMAEKFTYALPLGPYAVPISTFRAIGLKSPRLCSKRTLSSKAPGGHGRLCGWGRTGPQGWGRVREFFAHTLFYWEPTKV